MFHSHNNSPWGPIKAALLVAIFTTVNCFSDPPTTPSTPSHRGAARLKFGSGSLRDPADPVYAKGQKTEGIRTTIHPVLKNQRKIIPILESYPVFPYPIHFDEYPRDEDGYPISFPDLVPRIYTSRSRGGMYGGRPEYSNGKPNRMRIPPYDMMMPGKVMGPSLGRYTPDNQRTDQIKLSNDKNVQHPDSDDDLIVNPDFQNSCTWCPPGHYSCLKSCMCIHESLRCDGQIDCEYNEDEEECHLDYENAECDESKNNVRCTVSKKCISKDFLCDGDDDCGDFSDETHCGFAANCTSDEFECANGQCIPLTWVCDNDHDCRDDSDELTCNKTGCSKDEFECSDGLSCIPIIWKCDHQVDCSDQSDELECDIVPPFCNIEQFQCSTNKCIKRSFKCDGDDDCGDWSDEEDCPKVPGNCETGEFKCNNGKCIPERYRCDKQTDCDTNEDEANCDLTQVKKCSPDEYVCDSGDCILHTWKCDGLSDCPKGEDEANCDIVCDKAKFPCSGTGVNSNTTAYCILKKHVCDGQKDCPKGEDEQNCPSKRNCDAGTKCKQLCITTSEGYNACACEPGYNLADDGYSCEDINECMYATDPVCSQTCNNSIGSFRCGCMTGYVLRPDLRTCKAIGAPPTLLFANRVDIRQVSLNGHKYKAILRNLYNAIALDYHYTKGYIFWSDVSTDVIRRANINGTGKTDVIKWGLESPGGIAVDWIHNLIFWTDSGTRRIEVASIDGQQRAVLVSTELDKPRAIAVHPGESFVFWTDWGPNPKIERTEMDGGNRKSIISESVFWPNGLAIDHTSSRIYWADAKHNVIETSHFDGSDRKKVITRGLPHPFALTIFEDAIYWTDWHTKSISSANKLTGAGLRTIHSHLHFPMDIHSYHPQRQPKYKNKCVNSNCEHMCLPNQKSYTCACQMGQKLRSDKKSCLKPEKLLLFARKKDLRIKHMDNGLTPQPEMVIPVDGIKSAVAIAWDSKNDYIYWTDVERDSINRAHWNGSDQKVLVQTNLITPAGLALDWFTDNIYWTDADTDRIEVAKSNGEMRSLLIWEELDKPRDIVVDPLGGYMYWSDWGVKPKIERSAMDGRNRITIAKDNLTWPNGLAIDHAYGKLYWTDGGTRTIEYANLDGSSRKVLLHGNSIPHPFGLDVFGNYIYWSDWQTLEIERANKFTGTNRTTLSKSVNSLMDVRVFHRNRKTTKTSCSLNNGGCSHLCLLRPKGHSCACPTGIKLGTDGKICENGPINFLILAHRMDIRKISLDVPYLADVVLPLPPLKMATSVDVDRKTGDIYWTDTVEDTIQKSTSGAPGVHNILWHELAAPDGIAIDSTGRKMYWTDGERNSVEVAELDGSNRKLLFSKDMDNPRAITLHYHHGLMFWSDWGKEAKIEVAFMDGTNRKPLISSNLAWPNGLAIDRPANRLYWNDGKLNVIESSDLNGKDRRMVLKDVPHPYGLVVVGNHIYWTDWATRSLHRAEKLTGGDKTIIRDKLEGLMDVRSVQNDNIAENACGTNNGGCSHLCLRKPTGFICACPTGLNFLKNSVTECELLPSKYILVATRFAFSRISMDTEELWDTTLPIPANRSAMDVDYHWEQKRIYFTDIDSKSIQSASMYNTSEVTTVIRANVSSPNGIAIDWIADNIYFTNTGSKSIQVARLDGSSKKTILKKDMHDPRSVCVFPRKGYLYWSDWGPKAKIERSFLDGTERKIIVNEKLTFPIALTVDYAAKRLYWIDAKIGDERIETTDLAGKNRVMLNTQKTRPFSLSLFENFVYWTDWEKKSVFKADKTSGKDSAPIVNHLEDAMGISVISESRQMGWNPCVVDNGGCSHLCFFRKTNYICGCPDDQLICNQAPNPVVPIRCPEEKFHCDYENEEDDEENVPYYTHDVNETESQSENHHLFYMVTLIPMLLIILVCIALVLYVFVKKGKKKYLYAASRSFSNPNYYSNDPNAPVPNPTERKQFIWKRLKYDKSQERVYEETTGTNSPEVTSLIPTILTPCSSSNCETVTPEMERSPSITPLHRMDKPEIAMSIC